MKSDKPTTKMRRTIEKDKSPTTLKEALISSIGEGVIVINEYGMVTETNETASLMLGLTKNQLMGQWLPGTIPMKDLNGKDIPTSESTVSKAILLGKAVSETICYARSDGSMVPVFVTASPLMIKGKPAGAVIVFRDYSQELLVDKAKSEFVSFASHQLRTPLTTIRLYTEILKDSASGTLTPEQSQYVKRIETAIVKMIDLVSDFLNISKLELGELKIHPKNTDLTKLVKTHIDDLQALAEKKGVSIQYKSENVCMAHIDAQLINQILHNLLTNALRYTANNGAKIKVSITTQGKIAVVAVADNGIGIPLKSQDRIFERFFRAENAAEHQAEGTGLGLYLAKRLAKLSGGDLWFISNDKGTTFFLSLPKA